MASQLQYDVKFVVSNNISQLLILGSPFLNLVAPQIDYKTHNLWFEDPSFKQVFFPPSISKQVKVRTPYDLVIPARSEVVLPIPVKAMDCSALVEPTRTFNLRYGLLMGRAVNSITNGNVLLKFVNDNNNDVIIPRGERICRLCPFEKVMAINTHIDSTQHNIPENYLAGFELDQAEITDQERRQVEQLLRKYYPVFADRLGNTSIIQHRIELTENKIIKKNPYTIPRAYYDNVKQQLEDLVKQNIITPSRSSYSSPIVVVKKKDGSLRICNDFRELNSVTKKDVYPLPKIDTILSVLSGYLYLSTLDARSGFLQVPIHPDDRHLTAFTTPFGFYEYTRMPFGLCNAPATFQRMMDLILSGLTWEACLVYMDDIIVFGRTFEEHLHNLELVLAALQAADITIKPSKCKLFRKKIAFLGHVVSAAGIETDPEKIKRVTEMPAPTNTEQLRSFTGLTGYYRKFIANYAHICEPLNRLLRKGEPWVWSDEQQRAFDTLKEKLTTAPILAFPDFKSSFTLYTDASNSGLGAVLAQSQNGNEVAISYWSRTLNKAERNYSTTEKECLAVVDAIRHFRYYLLGTKFTVVVDHHSLKWLKTVKDNSQRLMRWSLALQEYDFDIVYRSGKKHSNADALSRLFNISEVKLNNILDEQEEDPTLKAYRDYLKDGSLPSDQSLAHNVRNACKDMIIQSDNLLYRIWQADPKSHPRYQLVVPTKLRPYILEQYHDTAFAGHLGFFKTYEKIRERFYWERMANDVARWIESCEACSRRKKKHLKGLIKNVEAKAPFDTIAMDILGPFHESRQGNRYIIVIIDYFTKWVECFALPTQSTADIAVKLVEEVICRHGSPKRILTDQGTNLDGAQLAKDIYKLLRTKKIRTSAYHPQTDGLAEKFNHTLASMLTHYVNEHQDDWDEHLNYVLFAYRTAVHESTKFSPFYLLYGRHPRLPMDPDLVDPDDVSAESYHEHAQQMIDKFNAAYDQVHKNVRKARKRQKKNTDKTKKQPKIDNDDQVWLDVGQIAPGTTAKLSYLNNGPYNIEKVNNNNTVDIVHAENTADKHKVNISRLRKQKKRDEDLKIQPLPSIDSTPETEVTPTTKTTAVVRASLEMPAELSETLQQIRRIIARPGFNKVAAQKKVLQSLLGVSSQFFTDTKRKEKFAEEISAARSADDLVKLIDRALDESGDSS